MFWFFLNMTVFSPRINPQAQYVVPYATALQIGFKVVDVFHPYNSLLTVYEGEKKGL